MFFKFYYILFYFFFFNIIFIISIFHIIIIYLNYITINKYKAIAEEKKARSMLMSSVERLLNKDTVVIADAMNYIKGFRYQLYCVAKSLRTPHCIVRYYIN